MNLSKVGWSWGCVATVDSDGRTIFVADAHRGEGKRFDVRADEKLSAFVELESAIVSALALWRSLSNQGVRKTFPVNGSFTSVPGGNWWTSM